MALLALKLFNLHATYLGLESASSLFASWHATDIATLGWYLPFFGVGGSKQAHARGALALFSGLHAVRSIVTSAVHFCSIIFCQGLSVFFEMSVLEGARRRQGCAPELELLDDGFVVSLPLPLGKKCFPSTPLRVFRMVLASLSRSRHREGERRRK